MNTETKRFVAAAARRTVFSALVIMLAWLGLLGLRGTISLNAISFINNQMRSQQNPPPPIPLNPWSWDWSKSLFSDRTVSSIVGQRLGATIGMLVASMLLSLLMASVLLFAAMLVRRVTEKPGWLAGTRRALGTIIVTAAVSMPVFAWGSMAIVYPAVWWGVNAESQVALWLGVFSASLLPAWLLVQYGQGEINRLRDEGFANTAIWRELSARLPVKTMRLIGAFVAISILVPMSGLATLGPVIRNGMPDYPVLFGIAWIFAVIVVLVRLAADLIEIAWDGFSGRSQLAARETAAGRRKGQGWLYLGLLLAGVSALVAALAPLIAPHGLNEMSLNARLAPPSSQYPLGTDNLGRDILSRVMFGIRQDLAISILAVIVLTAAAVAWALLASRLRKGNDWRSDTLEDLVMLPRDVLLAFPWLVLLIVLVTLTSVPVSGPVSLSLFSAPVVLGIGFALLPRVVSMVQEAYRSRPIESKGRGWLGAVLRALPAVFAFAVAGGVLYSATIGYLGFGVMPPSAELGLMLAGPSRRYILQAPWMAVWPSLTLISLLFAWVLAGEALATRFGYRASGLWSKVWE